MVAGSLSCPRPIVNGTRAAEAARAVEVRLGSGTEGVSSPRRPGLGMTVREQQIHTDGFQLAAIVESLSDPVFSTALDGTIESWNAGAELLYGYRADEIVGKSGRILVPPERVGEIEEILARVRIGEAIKQFETVRRRKDGANFEVSLSISPVRRSDGEIVGASVVAHDISELVRREQIQIFLAEASRLLAVNADSGRTLARIAQLTLSSLADWCMVEIGEAKGSLSQLVVAHADPAKAERMREMRRLYPPNPERPDIPLRVLTTGKAELIPE